MALFIENQDSTQTYMSIPEATVMRCISIKNDIHTGYFVLALGAAFIIGGFITRKS